jgi:hypothetical protein
MAAAFNYREFLLPNNSSLLHKTKQKHRIPENPELQLLLFAPTTETRL